MNELAHALLILILLQKLCGWQNGIRQHYTTLTGSMASYREHIQSENHTNLLTYLGKLTAVYSREWLLNAKAALS